MYFIARNAVSKKFRESAQSKNSFEILDYQLSLSRQIKSVITLTLLHPLQSVAVQSWEFTDEPSIRIGRASDNEVVLYSAVVSRHHIEIRKSGAEEWEVVNVGSNGTYVDGERIEKTKALDGMVIRLAKSGPKILLKIKSNSSQEQSDGSSKSNRARRQPKSAKDTLIS